MCVVVLGERRDVVDSLFKRLGTCMKYLSRETATRVACKSLPRLRKILR